MLCFFNRTPPKEQHIFNFFRLFLQATSTQRWTPSSTRFSVRNSGMHSKNSCAAGSTPPPAGRTATLALDTFNDVGVGATFLPLNRSFRRRRPPNWWQELQPPHPGTSPSGATFGTRTETSPMWISIWKRVVVCRNFFKLNDRMRWYANGCRRKG